MIATSFRAARAVDTSTVSSFKMPPIGVSGAFEEEAYSRRGDDAQKMYATDISGHTGINSMSGDVFSVGMVHALSVARNLVSVGPEDVASRTKKSIIVSTQVRPPSSHQASSGVIFFRGAVNQVIFSGTASTSSTRDFTYPSQFAVSPTENQLLVGAPIVDASDAVRLGQLPDQLISSVIKIYELEKSGKHRAATKEIFFFVESRFKDSDLDNVNSFLSILDLRKLSPWSITGLLRVTYRARKHLACWGSKFRNAQRLVEEGTISSTLLAGLKE